MKLALIFALTASLPGASTIEDQAAPRVLVFSKTTAYRHESIAAGVAAVRELAAEGGFEVDATEDARGFESKNLAKYRAVVFLNTSGMVFDDKQQAAFQGFIRGGGGLAAVHQGVTTLGEWPWYVGLVGGVKFNGHPRIQPAVCRCEVRDHPATKELPESWKVTDEWYNYTVNPRPRTHVLITVDEQSYQGGAMGADHPISWYHEAEGGRVWCTGLGHTREAYRDPLFRKHLLGGIKYAARLAPAVAADGLRKSSAGDQGVPAFDREAMARFARERRGDAERGRALFFDTKGADCGRCHRSRGHGGEVGPDLSDVGGKYERALLIESVLEPSRQIVEGYRSTVVATREGRVFSGICKVETPEELTLVDALGERRVIPKSAIEERGLSHTSLMPEGLAAKLSPRDLSDLISYLQSLKSAGQGTPLGHAVDSVVVPAGFAVHRIASGISGATALAIAPDGRAFVCEQTGALRVIRAEGLLATPVATFDVSGHWERGLIGVTVDPHFEENGYVYVCYIAARPYVHHRISRLTARGDVAAPSSEVVLLEGDDQAKLGGAEPAGHQGGAIHFGRDGKLYVAIGDQTAGLPAQALTTFQGKLLRLNADGSIPADNPFYREAVGKYRAIWAVGLRNPFTFAVAPGTGRIFINDVGQGAWEEVNEGVAGGNYGWPLAEGPTTDARFRGPIHHYPVASIAGGAFCPEGPSSGFPRRFHAKYFFMDFVRGFIDVLDPDGRRAVERFANGLARPVDLAFGPDGALYVLLRDAWVIDGNFRRGTGSLLRISAQSAGAAAS